MKKKIAILGATGSIGKTTIDVIRRNLNDFQIVLLANDSNMFELEKLMKEFQPVYAFCKQKRKLYINGVITNFEIDFLDKPDTYENVDIVVNGIVGIAGLKPSLAVLNTGGTLATANKESLVVAGSIIMKEKEKNNATIFPLDSEHSTIWQCMLGRKKDNIEKIILTASGGAFRDFSKEQLKNCKAVDALKHPTWKMGKKVTIDCATLMNKGMEIIEAKYLFGIKNIDVVLHRESIIHSMVLMKDTSIIAGLSYPDMRLPIQYALTYPRKIKTEMEILNFAKIKSLNFDEIDEDKFPCLKIAKEVSSKDDIAGAIMNSANEVLVKAYLENIISFYDIPNIINEALEKFYYKENHIETDEVFCIDKKVCEYTCKRIYGGKIC